MSMYQKYFDELNAKSENSSTVTSNWLIRIVQASDSGSGSEGGKAITSSKIPNYLDYCDLYEFRYNMNREIQKSATEPIKPDGGLHAGELEIVTGSSFLNADFNTIFHQNNCLDLDIVRIQSLKSESPILVESYTFKTSFVKKILVVGDVIAASFRYSDYSRTTSTTNTEGGKEGNISSSYKFSQATHAPNKL